MTSTADTSTFAPPDGEPADPHELRRDEFDLDAQIVIRSAWLAGRGWSASKIAAKFHTTGPRIIGALRRQKIEISRGRQPRGTTKWAIEMDVTVAERLEDLSENFGCAPEYLVGKLVTALDADDVRRLMRRR